VGGKFAARDTGTRIAPRLRRVDRLAGERRYAFRNNNPWVARLDGTFVGQFIQGLALVGRRVGAWAPDGRSLYVGTESAVLRLDPASGVAEEVAATAAPTVVLSCAPGGARLACTTGDGTADRLVIIDVATKAIDASSAPA
jgi:hypothetical protein